MTIKIGSIELENNVILAPMSGVSDMPYRRLAKRFGAGLVISEMIASQAMIYANRKTLKMASNCAEEFPMAVQLAGCEPQLMAEAARLNADRGAAIIDINMGCPVKKVTKGQAGSALMKDEKLAGQIFGAVVKAVDLPVTVKMRTGWNEQNRNAPTLAKIAENAGVKMLTVHGRTRNQSHDGLPRPRRTLDHHASRCGLPLLSSVDILATEYLHGFASDSPLVRACLNATPLDY